MSRLSVERVEQEIKDKGFTAHKIDHYRNLGTILEVSCSKEHIIAASLTDIRKASFRCDRCSGGNYTLASTPPQKEGLRVIGIDNATQNMGLSVFDDGKLVWQTLVRFSGNIFEDRLQTIFNMMEQTVIEEWEPDYIVFEDIQYQNNYQTYKKLAMLLGLLIVAAKNGGVEWDVVPPVTWRSHFNISGKRETVKKQAIMKVATMYNINVVDDVAEAILIGKYYIDKSLAKTQIKKAF